MNQAESVVHDTETKIEEYKDKLPADEVSQWLSYCSRIWELGDLLVIP